MNRLRILPHTGDDLDDYARTTVSRGFIDMNRGPAQPFGDATCFVIDRQPPFQAELCVFPPHAIVPPHVHPDVDSIEYWVCGEGELLVEGVNSQTRLPDFMRKIVETQCGVRIKPDAVHYGYAGVTGATFLSMQKWLNGIEPDHVGHNWEGRHYSDDQAERLGNPEVPEKYAKKYWGY